MDEKQEPRKLFQQMLLDENNLEHLLCIHLFFEKLSSVHLNMVILSYYSTDFEHLIKRRQIRLSLYSFCCLVAKPVFESKKEKRFFLFSKICC